MRNIILAFAVTALLGCSKSIELPKIESRLNQTGDSIMVSFEHEVYAEYLNLNSKPLNIYFTSNSAVIGCKTTIILNSGKNDIRVHTFDTQRYEITGVLNSNNPRTVTVTYLGQNVILVQAP